MKLHTLLVATLCVSMALSGCKPKQDSARSIPPVPVKVVTVVAADTIVYTEFVGQTMADQTVAISARVEGTLASIDFKDSSSVSQGDLLFTIDDRPLRAACDQARGAVAQAQVAAETSQRDWERVRTLYHSGGVSAQDFDAATLKAATAAANLVSSKAALDSAELQLGYARISAPISGLIGKSAVSVGNLVGPTRSGALTTIVDDDPIRVRFSIDERFYLETVKRDNPTKAPAGIFELTLADGTTHPQKGDLVFVDNQVDPKTGTLLVEAAFPNPGHKLLAGLFGRVKFPRKVVKDAIVVPQRAVQELQGTYSVIVVNADGKAEFRPIQVGPRQGAGWLVTTGLRTGEKIVVEGGQKLRPGSPLTVLSEPAR